MENEFIIYLLKLERAQSSIYCNELSTFIEPLGLTNNRPSFTHRTTTPVIHFLGHFLRGAVAIDGIQANTNANAF